MGQARYVPDQDLKIAIRYGETLRESLVELEAFAAAGAMRDLLMIAQFERERRDEFDKRAKALI